MPDSPRLEELLIYTLYGLLDDVEHIATGMASPIPAGAALLRRERDGTRVSVLASRNLHAFTAGGAELFDMAAQGRIGAFFLSGGQLDGQGNVNLVGVGDYPTMKVRWSGSFGSAYLYYLVPKVILFRLEHTRRTLVEKVDFISAPGTSPSEVYRPGGPHALITNRCLFMFDKALGRFRLTSIHPGESLESILDNTGFEFDIPDNVPTTAAPPGDMLEMIRGPVANLLRDPYPQFVSQVFA